MERRNRRTRRVKRLPGESSGFQKSCLQVTWTTKRSALKVTVNNLWVFFTNLHKHALTRVDVNKTMASYISIESLLNIESD